MKQWWLSFCDPDLPKGSQFLGVSIVEADTEFDAVTTSHLRGSNPGGEIKMIRLEGRPRVPDSYCHQLLKKSEIEQLEVIMTAAITAAAPPLH